MIAPGNTVNEGQPVMELETDKAVVEVPSSVAGVVKDVRVKEGDKLKVGQVIFTVENGAGTRSKPTEAPAKASRSDEPSAHTAAPTAGSEAPANRATAPEFAARPQARIPTADAPSAQSRSSVGSGSTATEFRLPELGENIEQGDLVRIMISAGAKVSEGQPVIELETDKAVVEVPSSVSGVVKEICVKEGETLKVGQVIFTLEGGAAEPVHAQHVPVEHASEQAEARLAFQTAMRAEGKTEEQVLPPDRPQIVAAAFSMPSQLGKTAGSSDREPVPAAPHVRRLARELGIDIHDVKG